LAFHAHGRPAVLWAAGCSAAQAVFLVLMWFGPFTSTGWPRIGKRRIFKTDRPDYQHFEALRSDYWRNTTAQALMMGRKAYGYVIWQKTDSHRIAGSISPKLAPLLTWNGGSGISDEQSNVLALLRSGTLGQAITFVVFRGTPPP